MAFCNRTLILQQLEFSTLGGSLGLIARAPEGNNPRQAGRQARIEDLYIIFHEDFIAERLTHEVCL